MCFFMKQASAKRNIFFNEKEIDGKGEEKYVRNQSVNMCLILSPSQIMRKLKSIAVNAFKYLLGLGGTKFFEC